jgi:hypothetical protein
MNAILQKREVDSKFKSLKDRPIAKAASPLGATKNDVLTLRPPQSLYTNQIKIISVQNLSFSQRWL